VVPEDKGHVSPFGASIIDSKLVVSGEVMGEIYLQFVPGIPSRVHHRGINPDGVSPTSVDKVVESFRIHQSDTDAIRYLES
jgi:hypothetical protein